MGIAKICKSNGFQDFCNSCNCIIKIGAKCFDTLWEIFAFFRTKCLMGDWHGRKPPSKLNDSSISFDFIHKKNKTMKAMLFTFFKWLYDCHLLLIEDSLWQWFPFWTSELFAKRCQRRRFIGPRHPFDCYKIFSWSNSADCDCLIPNLIPCCGSFGHSGVTSSIHHQLNNYCLAHSRRLVSKHGRGALNEV